MNPAPLRRLLAAATAALLVAFVAAACAGDGGAPAFKDGERLRVVASVAPVGALAEAVGGGLVDLDVLAGPGVDVHDFELSPADRRKIAEAHLVVHIGLGLDAFVEASASKGQLVTLGDGLPVLRRALGQQDYDPHVWHDVDDAKAMANVLAEAFGNVDRPNAAVYRANAAALAERLDAADREVRALIDAIPPSSRKVVTNHDAIGYFLDRYGLEFVGAVIPAQTTAAEPSAQDIARLAALIKEEGVRAIFAESSVDPKVALQLARDTGVKIIEGLYADSLGPPGSGADTIEGMLLANATKIVEALR